MVGHSPRASESEHSNTADQSLDALFGVLADQRRRHVLACLTDHTQAVAAADLAEDVAVRESEESSGEVSREEARTVYTSLYHQHLPRLVDAGVVEFDRDRDLVSVSESAGRAERVRSFAVDGTDDE